MKEENRLEFRRKLLLETTSELVLALEPGPTTLRIFTDFFSKNKQCKEDTIYFRLDRHKAYDAPLGTDSIAYLERESEPVKQLLEKYGFDGAKKKDLEDVLKIVSKLKTTKSNNW